MMMEENIGTEENAEQYVLHAFTCRYHGDPPENRSLGFIIELQVPEVLLKEKNKENITRFVGTHFTWLDSSIKHMLAQNDCGVVKHTDHLGNVPNALEDLRDAGFCLLRMDMHHIDDEMLEEHCHESISSYVYELLTRIERILQIDAVYHEDLSVGKSVSFSAGCDGIHACIAQPAEPTKFTEISFSHADISKEQEEFQTTAHMLSFDLTPEEVEEGNKQVIGRTDNGTSVTYGDALQCFAKRIAHEIDEAIVNELCR